MIISTLRVDPPDPLFLFWGPTRLRSAQARVDGRQGLRHWLGSQFSWYAHRHMTAEQGTDDDRFIREPGIAGAVAEAVRPALVELGYRLVRVQVSGRDGQTLQIMAERPDGTMSAGDCEKVSKQLSPMLDVMDPLSGAYRLEVSSPGIDRPLVRPTDFEDWSGYEAKINLKQAVSGKRRFRGTLEGYEGDEIRVEIEIKDGDGPVRREMVGFPIELVDDARLVLTDELIRESLRRAKKAHEGLADQVKDD
jgi:ribosome maturation factor RimP